MPGTASLGVVTRATTDPDVEMRFTYLSHSTSNNGKFLFVAPRNRNNDDRLYVEIFPDQMRIRQWKAGTQTVLDTNLDATTTADVEYDVRIVADGTNVTVWRDGVQVLSTTGATMELTGTVRFLPAASSDYDIDNVFVLADDLDETFTYTNDNSNRLTSLASDIDGTHSFTYDDWGRTNVETLPNLDELTYGWTSFNMLASVDSDATTDIDIQYSYRGDLKRVFRWEDETVVQAYDYGAGFDRLHEYDVVGASLDRAYIAGLAEIPGATRTAANTQYLTHDHLGSTRGVFDDSKASLGGFEYTPYGMPFAFSGPAGTTSLFWASRVILRIGMMGSFRDRLLIFSCSSGEMVP